MLFAFAAAPGKIAEDGSGNHSPFTDALLKQLVVPSIEIHEMFRLVRVDVVKQTERRQVPWVNDSLLGQIYLVGDQKPTANQEVVPKRAQ
jgi:uncharacterized caspase-like protein